MKKISRTIRARRTRKEMLDVLEGKCHCDYLAPYKMPYCLEPVAGFITYYEHKKTFTKRYLCLKHLNMYDLNMDPVQVYIYD